MSINGTERVVQQVDVCTSIDRTRERNTSLLPSRQRDALLADLGLVSLRQQLQVLLERASLEDELVKVGLEPVTERDIGLDRAAHDPRLLSTIRDRAADSDATVDLDHLTEDRCEQTRLAISDPADHGEELAPLDRERDVLEGVDRRRCRCRSISSGERRPRKVTLNNRDEFVAGPELPRWDLDLDGTGVELFRDEELGEAIDRDVGFDEGREDDGEDGEREPEQLEEGDGRENDLARQGLARDGREEGEGGESDGERRERPEEVGRRREDTCKIHELVQLLLGTAAAAAAHPSS